MQYPTAVIEKAKRAEILLQRVGAGEPLTVVCAELGLAVDEKRLSRLQAWYEAGGRSWEALLDGRFGHDVKANAVIKAWLYERKEQDDSLRAPQLAAEIAAKFGVHFSPGHINHLLRKRGLTAPPGRPYQSVATETETETSEVNQSLDNAGIFFPGSSESGVGGHRDG